MQSDGMGLALTSDGEGGVNVTAEADSIGREVRYRREETTNHIRDETREEKTEKREPFRWRHLMPALFIALAAVVILRREGNNS